MDRTKEKSVKYSYGSRPVDAYTYVNFVCHLAPVLPQDDKVFYWQNSLKWRSNRNSIPLGLFRNICHWKSPRRSDLVKQVIEGKVNDCWRRTLYHLDRQVLQDNDIINALQELTQLSGVAIPTASAILTAWNPIQFGIVDFRTLVVLGMRQDGARNNILVRDYINFRSRLLQLQQDHNELHDCALRQIELAMWYYYPV